MRRAIFAIGTVLLLTSMEVLAYGNRGVPATREVNQAIVDRAFASNTNKYAGSNDVLVLPGLLADRVEKRVSFFAETTGLGADDPAEFLLISLQSGHAYESIAVSFAKPSDIHKALEFIDVKPGRPAFYEKLCFWPKGERAIVTFQWNVPATPSTNTVAPDTNTTGATAQPAVEAHHVRAEALILDKRTGKQFPAEGFVFTGSTTITNAASPSGNGYAADLLEPNSIVSHYNDMETVLDVPRRAQQQEVYRFQYPNPEHLFPTGMLVEVIMQPEYPTGKQRVAALSLKAATANATNASGDNVLFSLSETGGSTLAENEPFHKLPALFEKYIADGRDPYVTVEFDSRLALDAICSAAKQLTAVDSNGGIRIEPPPPGQLYYMAFVPPEQFRDRAKRHAQPWEYRLSVTNGAIAGILTLPQEVRTEDGAGWTFKERNFDASTSAALNEALATKNERGMPIGLPVIYVFAPATMRYGDMMQLVRPALDANQTIFVYLTPSP